MTVAEKHIRHYNNLNGKPIRKQRLAEFHASLKRDIESKRIDAHMPFGVECIDLEKRLQGAIKTLNGHKMIVQCQTIDIAKIHASQKVIVKKSLAGFKKKKEKPKALDFGKDYSQFRNKPEEAILHLLKVKSGEVKSAIYRKGVGNIDFVWGEHNDKTGSGFGLSHIIAKHKKEMEEIGLKPEKIIPSTIRHGRFGKAKSKDRVEIKTDIFTVFINTKYLGSKKIFLLTAFDLRLREIKKQGLNGTVLGVDDSAPAKPKKPLPSLPLPHKDIKKHAKKSEPVQKQDPVKLSGVSSASQLCGVKFYEHDLGPFKSDFHRMNSDTNVMIWGLPGGGKTVMLLKLAQHFAQSGKKVLYIAEEEFGKSTLAEKIQEFKIGHDNLHFVGELNESLLADYDIIFFDSVNSMNLTSHEIKRLDKKFPNKTFILIVQTTKAGDFRGGQDWEHLVDIAGEIRNRKLILRKNRLDPNHKHKADKIMLDEIVEEQRKKEEIKKLVKSDPKQDPTIKQQS